MSDNIASKILKSQDVIGRSKYNQLKSYDFDVMDENNMINFRLINKISVAKAKEAIKKFEKRYNSSQITKETKEYIKNLSKPRKKKIINIDKKWLYRKFDKEYLKQNGVKYSHNKDSIQNIMPLIYYFIGDFENFKKALCDDLNTPLALKHLHGRMNQLNLMLRDNSAGGKNSRPRNKWLLLEMGKWMGLLQQDPEVWFKWQPAGAEGGIEDEAIEALTAEYEKVRADKKFSRSDEIRDQLAAEGIVLETNADGKTDWRRK